MGMCYFRIWVFPDLHMAACTFLLDVVYHLALHILATANCGGGHGDERGLYRTIPSADAAAAYGRGFKANRPSRFPKGKRTDLTPPLIVTAYHVQELF